MGAKEARRNSGAGNEIPDAERSAINPTRRKGRKSAEYSAALKQAVKTLKDDARERNALDIPAKRIGRPSSYTEQLGEEICYRLCNGETLIDICDSDSRFPHRMTVYRWMEEHPSFAAMYARARMGFGEHAAHHVVSTAKTADENNASAVKILVDAFKWYAEKAAPKLYNSRVAEGAIHREQTTINHVTNNLLISGRDIAPDQRDQLRAMLIAARATTVNSQGDKD